MAGRYISDQCDPNEGEPHHEDCEDRVDCACPCHEEDDDAD